MHTTVHPLLEPPRLLIFEKFSHLLTRLLEPPHLFIFGEISNDKIILSSFQHLFCCFNHFKVTSKSQTKP